MRNPIKFLTTGLIFLMLASCGTVQTASEQKESTQPEQTQEVKADPEKEVIKSLSSLYKKEELKGWQHKAPLKDKIPGMSVDKAYARLLADMPQGETVIVAVLDSGMDIDHEDLKDVIWTNEDEIPGNGIDDDKNGYVDDVHGWNFLGSRDGKNAYEEQLEMARLIKKYRGQWQDKTEEDIPEEYLELFRDYKRAEKELAEKLKEIKQIANKTEFLENMAKNYDNTLKKYLNTDELTEEKVKAIETDDKAVLEAKEKFLNGLSMYNEDFKNWIKRRKNYTESQLKYNLNIDFDGRAIVGDNPDDWNDRDYGNPNVRPVKEEEAHATHVAGIIAAVRNNGIGMNGIADNVKIMPIRAVPDGDEYDKDIALGIRYAVDNGAKIINCSFGKYYSPHKEWVWDAIKYAADHDVLIVNAAGNDAKDMDRFGEFISYPNDGIKPGEEIADNFITIGAYGPHFAADLPAPFSNYGKTTVDVFSPGVRIYSTIPFNKYAFFNGTSMAAPDAAGVAALIRSRFPELSASEVKEILMKSGITPAILVFVPSEDKEIPDVKPFKELSKSGKIVNAFNALVMAKKMAEKKKENN